MTDILDSRAIGRTDCFAQRFMRPGRYAYNVLPAYAHAISVDRPFEIIVGEEKSPDGMSQHNISVSASRGLFTVEPATLEIALGDLVLWNSANKNRGSFGIVGDQDFFDSTRMANECGYSHAFGLPGEYRWRDVHGSDVSGVVRVASPTCKDARQLGEWHRKVGEGMLVMISGNEVKPREVDVMVGQTVFFAIVTSKGISITDERLIEIGGKTLC